MRTIKSKPAVAEVLATLTLTTCALVIGIGVAIAGQGESRPSVFAQQDQADARPPLSDETAAEIKQVIQTLKRAALDSDVNVRAAAVTALSAFVKYDGEIFDVLWEATKSDDAQLKQAGVRAIIASGESSGKAIDGLLHLAGDRQLDEESRELVLSRLHGFGAEAVVPRAVDAIENGELGVKLRAIEVLTAFGRESQPAVQILLNAGMSQDSDAQLRAAALTSASMITIQVANYETETRAYEAQAISLAQQLISQSDVNGDGSLSLDGSEGDVSTSYARYDADGDGLLTAKELVPRYVSQLRSSASRQGREGRGRTTTSRSGFGGFEDATQQRGGRGGFERANDWDSGDWGGE